MKRTLASASDGDRSRAAAADILYPEHYLWIVFLAVMDLVFTSLILLLGGSEVNWLAAAIIEKHDLQGIVIFKFAMVTTAVLAIEAVGRRKPDLGEKVVRIGVLLSATPVVVGFAQLVLFARHIYTG